MSAVITIEKPPGDATIPQADGEERVGIAILSTAPINKFGLLIFREAVRLALESEAISADWIGGYFGSGLAGYGLPFVKGVGGFVVMIAGVEDRKGALNALHKVVPEKALPYEVAWFDKAEECWRTVHATQSAFGLLRFERFLTKEIQDEFESVINAPDHELEKFCAALKHFVEAAQKNERGE